MKTHLYFPFRLLTFLLLILIGCKKESDTDSTTVTDIDGNVYHTVTIGTQVWMVENLKATKYRNGDPIPNVTNGSGWAALTSGGYCWYNNDAAMFKASFGALYNWYAVADIRKIAPAGWHVPTDAEWTTLSDYLGGQSEAGTKLKETGTVHWAFPNPMATNSSGFTALPGGYRYYSGSFLDCGYTGNWWSSTEKSTLDAWVRLVDLNYSTMHISENEKVFGLSVRCLRD